jgi:hypothetical protein
LCEENRKLVSIFETNLQEFVRGKVLCSVALNLTDDTYDVPDKVSEDDEPNDIEDINDVQK